MHAPRDDHPVAGAAGRAERHRLIALRRPVRAEAAEVGAPELGGEPLGPAEDVRAHVQVVGAGRERQVEEEEVVGEMGCACGGVVKGVISAAGKAAAASASGVSRWSRRRF